MQNFDTMPCNFEAEKSVVSSLTVDTNLYWTKRVEPEDIYDLQLRKFMKWIVSLVKQDKPVDYVNLTEELEGKLEEDYIVDVMSYSFSTNEYKSHEDIVLENSMYRKAIELCKSVANKSLWKQGIDAVKQEVMKFMEVWVKNQETHTLVKWSVDTAMWLENADEDILLAPFGVKVLDQCLRWYRKWSLITIGARPAVWKSMVALNLVARLVKNWVRCSFFSVEMSAKEIHLRYLAMLAQVSQWAMEMKNEKALEKVIEALWRVDCDGECNIYDSFQDYDTMVQLIHKEAMLWSKYVFIDYLQKIKNKWKYNNMHHNISDMSMGLKHLAQKLWIQIVMLAQLNRESAKWVPRKPILSDLKESWSIEEDSVAVILLHDEWMSDPDSGVKNELDIIVAKNRHWPRWDFKVRVNKPTFTIKDL